MHDGPATLYDVAREAGVSLATASRVLNGSTRQVAADYSKRVRAAAARIGYTPNLSAQAVARGSSRLVALLVGDIVDPYFAAIAAGVSRAADRAGLFVAVSVTDRDAYQELELVRSLRGLRPQVIVLGTSRDVHSDAEVELDAELAAFAADGGRVVMIGAPDDAVHASVSMANAEGAAALADALVQRYPRRTFAVLAGPAGLGNAAERTGGFRDALHSHGISLTDALVMHGPVSRDGGHDAAAGLFAAGLRAPAVVFAVTDVMALGAMTAIREAGLRIPEDVAVAGFDDVPTAQDAAPPLTTVAVDLEALGEAAVEVALADDERGRVPSMPARVVMRDSA